MLMSMLMSMSMLLTMAMMTMVSMGKSNITQSSLVYLVEWVCLVRLC